MFGAGTERGVLMRRMAARRLLVLVGVIGLTVASASTASVVRAVHPWSMTIYNSSLVQPQRTNCFCVVASARAWLRHTNSSITTNQAVLDDYMRDHDYYNWDDPNFRDYIKCTERYSLAYPSPSYAHDSRGFAWTMWEYASASHTLGFRDYSSTNQSTMNWRIVRGIRATNDPVGVTVKAGKHEWLAVGFTTYDDPKYYDSTENAIFGFKIWDPWFNSGFGNIGLNNYEPLGYTGNTYIDIADWNQYFFKADANEGPFYDGKYVAVLRSVGTSNPDVNTSQNYGDWWFEDVNGHPPSAATSNVVNSQDTMLQTTSSQANAMQGEISRSTGTEMSLVDALNVGISRNHLFGDADYGNLTSGFGIGRTLRVESQAHEWPSFHLAELISSGQVTAIAVVNELDGGFRFGQIMGVSQGSRLPLQSALDKGVADAGLDGPAKLLWAPTERGNPHFSPFVAGVDPVTRETEVIVPGGTQNASRLFEAP